MSPWSRFFRQVQGGGMNCAASNAAWSAGNQDRPGRRSLRRIGTHQVCCCQPDARRQLARRCLPASLRQRDSCFLATDRRLLPSCGAGCRLRGRLLVVKLTVSGGCFVEVGAGKLLSGLVKRVANGAGRDRVLVELILLYSLWLYLSFRRLKITHCGLC